MLTCTDFKKVEILLFGDNLFNQFHNNRILNAVNTSIVLSKRSDGTFFYSILRCEKMGHRQYYLHVLNFYFIFSALDFILFTYSFWLSILFGLFLTNHYDRTVLIFSLPFNSKYSISLNKDKSIVWLHCISFNFYKKLIIWAEKIEINVFNAIIWEFLWTITSCVDFVYVCKRHSWKLYFQYFATKICPANFFSMKAG